MIFAAFNTCDIVLEVELQKARILANETDPVDIPGQCVPIPFLQRRQVDSTQLQLTCHLVNADAAMLPAFAQAPADVGQQVLPAGRLLLFRLGGRMGLCLVAFGHY